MKTNDHSISSVNLIGSQLLREHRYDEAIKWFSNAVEQNPGMDCWWDSLARALEKKGRFLESLSAYESALRLQPNNPEYWNSCGVMHNVLGNMGHAETAFREALRLKPDFPNIKYNLQDLLSRKNGVQKLNQNAPDAVGEIFTEHDLLDLIERMKIQVKAAPADTSLAIRLCILLERINDNVSASKLLSRVLKQSPDSMQALDLLAKIQMRLSQPQKAVVTCRKMVDLDPGDFSRYLILAEAFTASSHLKESAEAIRTAIELAPDSAECWVAWAQVLELCEDDAHYLALQRAAELTRFDDNLWFNVGSLAVKKLDYERAIDAFKKAGELAPKSNRNWVALGRVLEKCGRNSEAEEIYNMVIAYDPQAPKAWNNLGVLRIYRGDVIGAEDAFRRAIDSAPDFPNPWYNLRDILLSRGDKVAAQQAKDRGDAIKTSSAKWEADDV